MSRFWAVSECSRKTAIMNFIPVVFTLLVITTAKSLADHRNSTKSSPADKTEKSWKIEGSVCPHKDYRSYVQCLQTHRRHETPRATIEILSLPGGGTPGGSVNCLEECERESCRHQSSGPCAEVCYDRCLKKTKEIHHRITEYESTCGEGEDCDNSGKSPSSRGIPAIANLTTSIDIRNYLNNTNVIMNTNPKIDEGDRIDRGQKNNDNHDHRGSNTTCKSGQPGCEGTGVEDGHRGLGPPRGLPPGFQPWYPSPSLTLIPQIQMVPQVTFGLGISPGVGFGGGCPYASIWLCIPQQQQQQQIQQARDCSGCEQPYPYQRGRCDSSC